MACDETGLIPAEDLIAAAGKVKEVEKDGQRVVKHSLGDLIKLDEHLARRRNACGNPFGRLRFARVVPPSAVGEERT